MDQIRAGGIIRGTPVITKQLEVVEGKLKFYSRLYNAKIVSLPIDIMKTIYGSLSLNQHFA